MRTLSHFILILFLGFLLACAGKDELKSVKLWKYRDGFYMGDVIDFNQEDIKVKNDTIYLKNAAVGIVDKIEKRIGDKVLHIKNPKDGATGTYVSK